MSAPSSQPASLYAAREPVFPRRVTGHFRTLKWWIMGITLGIYYILPWIRWDRGPNLPDQAVLVDLATRRFFFFWIEIWPHEFYFVAGLLIMAGLGLFLFTSALGRVWCGYACPQTVWTDLFILVERWVEGDRNARVRLWNAPWDARKIRLRLEKWAIWLLIALCTGGAWVFYFTDAPTLLRDLASFDASPVAYTTIAILTATTFTFGGFMREQICIYMCPWPRIQGAMMDESTLTVAYREWRGEPRGKHRRRRDMAEKVDQAIATTRAAGPVEGSRSPLLPMPGLPSGVGGPILVGDRTGDDRMGDCIDCMACVNVCPMGIDIRDGQQLACITCALCIDACNEVMDKVGKPRGLIGYMALADEPAERAGQPPKSVWKHVFRPRTVLYTALWSLVGMGLLVALLLRTDLDMTVAPVRNPLFVTLSDGTIRNTYDVRLRNKQGHDRALRLSVVSDAPLALQVEGAENGVVTVGPDETVLRRVYLTAAPGSPAAEAGRSDATLLVEDAGPVEGAGTHRMVGTVFTGRGR